jgi:hypothetical protein
MTKLILLNTQLETLNFRVNIYKMSLDFNKENEWHVVQSLFTIFFNRQKMIEMPFLGE